MVKYLEWSPLGRGTMLSNIGIRKALESGEMEISPFYDSQLGPCSYDVTLGPLYRKIQRKSQLLYLCEFEEDYSYAQDMTKDDGKMILMPGEAALAITQEEIYLGPQMAAQVHSKSSLGRLMQTAHAGGAGFCDAGFRGHVTLEIINLLNMPVVYTAGMMVAQLTFTQLDTPADPVYDMRDGQYSNKVAEPMAAKKIKMGGAR